MENTTVIVSQFISFCLYLAITAIAVKQSFASQVLSTRLSQHLVFGSAASLFLLWFFQTGIYEGLNVHFLWLTANVLVLGFRLAIISAFLALTGITIIGHESWQMFGVNGLLGVILPMTVSYLIYTLTFHRLPKHIFIYIFVCGFFAGALTITVKMLLLGGYYTLFGVYDWQTIVDNYLILILLLLFPEGLFNGMTMTMLVIYKPLWVYTFRDKIYLDKQ